MIDVIKVTENMKIGHKIWMG